MSVNEFGEIGCFLQYSEFENKQGKIEGIIYEWRIRGVATAKQDDATWGWKAGDKVYKTSQGYVTAPDELVFMPKERERSLKPCIMRALKYAQGKWPGVRMETH